MTMPRNASPRNSSRSLLSEASSGRSWTKELWVRAKRRSERSRKRTPNADSRACFRWRIIVVEPAALSVDHSSQSSGEASIRSGTMEPSSISPSVAPLMSPQHRQTNLAADLERRLSSEALRVLQEVATLAEAEEKSLYLVGGIVRDLILGWPNLDLDLVLEGDAVALARALADRVGGRVVTHRQFGTATVYVNSLAIDLATGPYRVLSQAGRPAPGASRRHRRRPASSGLHRQRHGSNPVTCGLWPSHRPAERPREPQRRAGAGDPRPQLHRRRHANPSGRPLRAAARVPARGGHGVVAAAGCGDALYDLRRPATPRAATHPGGGAPGGGDREGLRPGCIAGGPSRPALGPGALPGFPTSAEGRRRKPQGVRWAVDAPDVGARPGGAGRASALPRAPGPAWPRTRAASPPPSKTSRRPACLAAGSPRRWRATFPKLSGLAASPAIRQ